VTGANQGFQIFWADNRPNGTYFEHYEGGASLNTFYTTEFDWQGGPNWKVVVNGISLGTSTDNGAWGGASDTGIETTTASARFAAWTRYWQYADPSWTWHNASNAGDGESKIGSLNVNGYIFPDTPGDDPVQTGLGSNSCSSGTLSTGAAVRPAAPRFTTPASFTALALKAAKVNGDAHPASVTYVKTTSAQAAAFTGKRPGKSHPVYVIQMRGHFNGRYASVPRGAKHPAGDTMVMVVNAVTGQLTDAGLTRHPAVLSKFGHPLTLPLTR
jgi:hypothetical protein